MLTALLLSLVVAFEDVKTVAPTPAARSITSTDSSQGYYRMPSIRGDTVVFVAEGDLWRVDAKGGRATRLTSHPGEERLPAISPDGSTLAFVATYEGPREVYTMPMGGGLPTRRTYDGMPIAFVGWEKDGTLLYASDAETARRSARLFKHDLKTDTRTLVPLAQCADGAFVDPSTLVFTRLEFQGSHTDRYQGGTAQQLWRFAVPKAGERGDEAVPLTRDYAGTSKAPMVDLAGGDGRVYFVTDRSGRMNVWSMRPDGTDLTQHTRQTEFDIGAASVDHGKIVYQLGPDLWVHDIARGESTRIPITLDSDFDQMREQWITGAAKDASSVSLSPKGDRIAVTTRGRVFVVPVKQGRTVDVDRRPGIRYRAARFLNDDTLVAISDEYGELEIVTMPANGLGAPTRLTTDGATVRWQAVASPDGTKIAHTDKRLRLWVFDVAKGTNTLVEENSIDDIDDLSWSPDSRWLAYVAQAPNTYKQVKLWPADGGQTLVATSDRYYSYRPQWSPDGQWLWFISDRTLQSVVNSPWGPRQPEPYFDKTSKVYALALKAGTRWPFQPDDELSAKKKANEKSPEKSPETNPEKTPKDAPTPDRAKDDAKPATDKPTEKPDSAEKPVKVEIDADGLASRLFEVPMPVAQLTGSPLLVTKNAIFWISQDREDDDSKPPSGGVLTALAISNEKPEPKTVMSGVRSAQLSEDGKKILVRKGETWSVIDARPEPANAEKSAIDLGGIALSVTPRDEWREMAIDAWRLLRDYFYDRNMHGVDWRAVLDKYLPWVDRVRSREELSDVLQEMTGELSALHHFVQGGVRRGNDRIDPASLGAELARDDAAGGWRVASIPMFDPDEPTARPPLAMPSVDVQVGDVIVAIDGVPTLSVPNPSMLLRAKAGRQTLLKVAPKSGGDAREVIVTPVDIAAYNELRYRGWELERRRLVEDLGAGDLGYVHLRAMGGGDYSAFARDYYPIFTRKGLIIDARGNRGGNIDSWILSRLMRRAWMYWSQPAGRAPAWNMQWAFRGPMVILCDEDTASDGEALSEGFRRLGLGKVIGTRTWGGEIWLSSSNRLVDGGIATAGENGVFDANGVWLIEGHGVEPDIVVDNLPHATFLGDDAQLKAAIQELQQEIKRRPVDVPPVPPAPNKSAKK
ncbi:MAG: S41 family peptidase [Phycisphaerales bacterium]